MNRTNILAWIIFLFLFSDCSGESRNAETGPEKTIAGAATSVFPINEVNRDEIKPGENTIAITGATLIDGNGGPLLENACVVIRGALIDQVEEMSACTIPEGAQMVDASGMFLMPGLIDAHFHLDEQGEMLPLFLSKGITTIRDPGAWMESYSGIRATGRPIPRLFLTGPHLDEYPPAYPDNSLLVRDAEEARVAVNRFAVQGASAIKVYFRLPLGTIKAICETADLYGIPVTGHLEITHAGDAVRAGLDGIEHITSFGTALLPLPDAEVYRKRILTDNNARRRGRYEVWSGLRFDQNPLVDSLNEILVEEGTFICPTLATFERQTDRGDSIEVVGFKNMLAFVGIARSAGARIVVGSHTWAPYSEAGYAYAREMELLSQAGLTNAEIIVAATMENARFFRIEERLGSIQEGKIADLLLLSENPLENISAVRSVHRVMLNGVWMEN